MESIEVTYDYTNLNADFINESGERTPILISGRGHNYSAIPLHKLLPMNVQPVLSAWLEKTLRQMTEQEVPMLWRIAFCILVSHMIEKHRAISIYLSTKAEYIVKDFFQTAARYFHSNNQIITAMDEKTRAFDMAFYFQDTTIGEYEKHIRPGGRIACCVETPFILDKTLWEDCRFFQTRQGIIQTARFRVKQPGYFGYDEDKRKRWNEFQRSLFEISEIIRSLSFIDNKELDTLIDQIVILEQTVTSLYEDLVGCDDIKYYLNLVKEAVIHYRLAEQRERNVWEDECRKRMGMLGVS